jgi:hypothetical protein
MVLFEEFLKKEKIAEVQNLFYLSMITRTNLLFKAVVNFQRIICFITQKSY